MQIVVVGGMPPNPEGEAEYTARVFRCLAAQVRDPIVVLAHVQPGVQRADRLLANLRVERVTHGYDRIRRHAAPFYVLRALARLRPDVVHFQAPHKGLYGGLYGEPLLYVLRSLRNYGIPTVVTLHSLWLKKDFADMAAERNMPVHVARLLGYLYGGYMRLLFRLATQVNGLVAGDTNPVIYEFQREWALERFSLWPEVHPCDPERATKERYPHHAVENRVTTRRLVFSFGFIRPDKGFEYLLEAVAPLVERDEYLSVVIAGSLPDRRSQLYAHELIGLHRRLGSPNRIHLRFGYLPSDVKDGYLRAADVLVLPYIRAMGASGPMHEALSYGKPVVATAVGQNRGLGEVCKLVPPRNADALRAGLEEILYRPHCWNDYQDRAARYAAAHTWSRLAEGYYRGYQRLLFKGVRG